MIMEKERILDQISKLLRKMEYFPFSTRMLSEKNLQFDLVFRGTDPLGLIIVEIQGESSEKWLRHFKRRVDEVVWGLHAKRKAHLLTAILVVEEKLLGSTLRWKLSQKLTFSLYVVPENLSTEQLREAFIPLGNLNIPEKNLQIIDIESATKNLARYFADSKESIIGDLLNLTEDLSTPELISETQRKDYHRRIKEIQDALDRIDTE